MKHENPPRRRAANLSLDSELLTEAKALSVNLSRAAEEGIAKAVSAEKSRRWKIENHEAIERWNEYIDKNGLPLAKYRDAAWLDTTSS